ncbi:MAG: Gfo/Idh/MocA family oxidoreductase [Eubacteriales bacterium]|nr:Gfo/Idh/MocA family oxidoreductase [Eubacteriales bacterium]MDY3942162.1 Gfo/Idh/MocA family oxidoreductase [Eubacteriales bacterium]
MEKFRVGQIGLGGRGMGHLSGIFCERDDVVVTYVCDVYEDRCAAAVKMVEEKNGNTPKSTTNYKEVCESPDVDVVIVTSAWENHIPACVYAMECGKQVATEVGGAYSIDDCWKLVNTYEKTGIHCMMLENCCYDRNEMMVMKMVREGLFGKIVHCEGGYQHDLRGEVSHGAENRHYRLRNYQNRCCENYPTHELGPIAKILDINRGNRMLKLVSMASGAWGLNAFAEAHDDVDPALRSYPFKQGDVVKTLIQCAHGETICLTLDTTLPRYYSRNFTIRGTKGFFGETENMVYIDGKCVEFGHDNFNNVAEYRKEWEHPVWKHFEEEGVKGGHGGMDWLVFDAYFSALRDGMVPPIDTYDTAAWMAITPLSEISIANGSMPVDIPDFTRGMWTHRTDKNTGFYALDK